MVNHALKHLDLPPLPSKPKAVQPACKFLKLQPMFIIVSWSSWTSKMRSPWVKCGPLPMAHLHLSKLVPPLVQGLVQCWGHNLLIIKCWWQICSVVHVEPKLMILNCVLVSKCNHFPNCLWKMKAKSSSKLRRKSVMGSQYSSTSYHAPSLKTRVVFNHMSPSLGANVVSTYFASFVFRCKKMWVNPVPTFCKTPQNHAQLYRAYGRLQQRIGLNLADH